MDEKTASSDPILLVSHSDQHEKQYLTDGASGPSRMGSRSQARARRPQIVQSDKIWEYPLELSNIAMGWHSLVFCVSLDKLDRRSLASITFDAKLGDERKCNMKTNISDSSTYLYPTITINTIAGTKTPLSFELHRIELVTSCTKAYGTEEPVHTLYGEDKPDQFITVGDSRTQPVEICAYNISDMGTYAVTLYFIDRTAHLDVWHIQKQAKKPVTPQSMTARFAISFQLGDDNEATDLKYDVAISSTGSLVAVSSYHELRKTTTPLSIYNCETVTPADHRQGDPWPLQKIPVAELSDASGYVAFRTIDPESSYKRNERFFKFDGVTFEVYKASGKWRRLFSLPVSISGMPAARRAEDLFCSIRERYFAYTGTRGLVLIWDFKASKMVSYISVPEDTTPVRASISRNGSLVAIAVKGEIHVHDVQSGIRLGSLNKNLNETNDFEMDFVQGYLTTLNSAAPTTEYASQFKTRSVVRVRDMSIVDTYSIYPQYRLQTPQANGASIFAFSQGATLNVITHDDHTLTREAPQCIDCRATIDIPIHQFHDDPFNLEAPYGPTLEDTVHEIKDAASGRNTTCPSASILQIKDARGTKMSAKISLGKEHSTGQGFYLQESSQIFILSSCFLHVWNLSTTGRSICELAYIWKLDPDDESKHSGEYNPRTLLAAKMCEHGKNVRISLSAARWFHHSKRLPEGVLGKIDIVTTPISSKDTLKMTMDMRLAGGLQYLGTIHANSGPSVRESVQRYLDRSLNKHPESSLKSLCHAWSHENRTWLESRISEFLPLDRVTWIPHCCSSRDLNPLVTLLLKITQEPKVIELVKIITDYCTHHATRTKDPGFLAPIIASMPQLMKHFPDYASVILTKVSYIPTKQRAFILHNHIVAYPPKVFLKFWKSKKKSLAKTKHPTLQLNDFLSEPNHKNNKFRRPLYIASFNMLWNYNDKTISEMSVPNDSTWRWRTWRTWYHMFTLKLRLRTHKYVECHDFNLEVFDNPAIRALVKYKWNTIGFRYWSFRFTFQLIFYILVIVAALLQVFRHELYTAHVTAVFISIIVFGVIFLWLELLQAIKHGKRYRTIYNLLDILGYTVPVCTSIQQMLVLRENNPNGYTKTLSFAVLIVFLHALFELRVFKSVCKYVSIIQHTVVEIRAFFFIFAA
ncbi:hypothetical protein BGZ67_010566, partial [Mortierella alpina]